jgi:threonylcarbamoyladenosine tRNA methylthiotransferase MtaB
LQGVRSLASNGFKEVVLTGIHLGAYGLDLAPAESLTELVRRIDSERLVTRLRIGSVEPNELTDELLALMAGSKVICPHLHLPLQSGSDTVLQRMGRRYSAGFFRDLVGRISTALPQAFIGADVIAGFPGESDEEFNETVRLIEDLPFSDLHVFPYSSRPGTKAAGLPGQVPGNVINKRAALLRGAAAQKKAGFLEKQLGCNLMVLVQGYDDNSMICNGISKNYVMVKFSGHPGIINSEQVIRVTGGVSEYVTGQPLKIEPLYK